MNTRSLEKGEAANLRSLLNAGIECALIYLTETGLKKSILDATAPVRKLLFESGVHDYDSQGQGEKSKIALKGTIFKNGLLNTIDISLYRPQTKKGDPRIWPKNLKKNTKPNDVIAIFCHDKVIHLVNLSEDTDIPLDQPDTPLSQFLSEQQLDYNKISDELLSKFVLIAANGPLKAVGDGDTSIGATIENALDIKINSNMNPDYKGIEIKSKRKQSNTRSTLFAQVPNWELSNFKSSREIVEKIGYNIPNEGCRKLYCTVSTMNPNSQGLILDLDLDKEELHELIEKNRHSHPVCLWQLPKLHERLHQKHQETFWVEAEEQRTGSTVFFKLLNIKHTRRPSTQQFDRLIGSGEITIDHLIKKSAKNVVREKGPLFKIKGSSINELFLGTPREFNLQ